MRQLTSQNSTCRWRQSLRHLKRMNVPLPAAFRAKRSYDPLIVLVLMEMALIGMEVLFQLHNSWLYEVRQIERF